MITTEMMRLANERLKLIIADIPEDKKPHVGVRADAILLCPGYSKGDAVRQPKAQNGEVRWYYLDCTIVLHYIGGHWRVKAIEPPWMKQRRTSVEAVL